MEEKVYEMPEDHRQAVQKLLDCIELRDHLAKSLKSVTPEKRLEGQELVAQMSEEIEKIEAVLAAEYDDYQKQCRKEAEVDAYMEDVKERMAMLFIHAKYNHPEKFEELRADILKDYTPEELQEFNDRVTHLEATQLRSIIAQVGDTEADLDRKINEMAAKTAGG